MPYPIPSQAELVTGKDGRMTQSWYGFLYNLTRTITPAPAPAPASFVFPEAPQDGAIYGRKNAAWTQTGQPGPPLQSLQFNDGHAFGGAFNLRWDKAVNSLTFLAPSKLAVDAGNLTSGAAGFYVEGRNSGSSTDVSYLKIYPPVGASNNASGFVGFRNNVTQANNACMLIRIDSQDSYFGSFGFGTTPAPPFAWGFGFGMFSAHMYPNANLYLYPSANPGSVLADSGEKLRVGGTMRVDGKSTFVAPSSSAASINLPHGSAPAAPANGDSWTTTAGLFLRINGVTIGPLLDAASGGSGSVPYFIPSSETFNVPLYKQSLFGIPLDIEGILSVDGYLLEVN